MLAFLTSLLLCGAAFGQKTIKPLFPPENIKPYAGATSGIGANPYIDSGIYGPDIIPGKVSFGGLGPIRGSVGLLGQQDLVGDQGGALFTHQKPREQFNNRGDTGAGGIGGTSIQPDSQQIASPVPVPYPVPVPQPAPERRRETVRVPYPVRVPVPVRIPQPVTVPIPRPVQIRVPQPYPVRVPEPYPVPVGSGAQTTRPNGNEIGTGGIAGLDRNRIDRYPEKKPFTRQRYDDCVYRYGYRACYGQDIGVGIGGYFPMYGMPTGYGGMRGRPTGPGLADLWMAREFLDFDFGFPDMGDLGYLAMLGQGGLGGFGRGRGLIGGRFGGGRFGLGGILGGRHGIGLGGIGGGAFGGGYGFGMGLGGGMGIGGRPGYGGRFGGAFGRGGDFGFGMGGLRRGGKGGEGGGEGGSGSGSGSEGYYWFHSENDD